MPTIGVCEGKTHLSRLLQRVAAGEEITITIHGNLVASLVPYGGPSNRSLQAAIDRLRELSEKATLNGDCVRDLIAQGRRY